jgi:hypothetical protein
MKPVTVALRVVTAALLLFVMPASVIAAVTLAPFLAIHPISLPPFSTSRRAPARMKIGSRIVGR